MPARNTEIQFMFAGGLDLESKGGITIAPEPMIQIPYLTEAKNVLYEKDNTVRLDEPMGSGRRR